VIGGGGRARPLVMGAVLIALIGVWMTHTAEYVRIGGPTEAWHVLTGSVHLYMLPTAGILALVAALGAARLWRAWTALGWRLQSTRAAIAAVWRGRQPSHPLPPAHALPPFGCRLLALWLPLAVVQAALYLLQENAEARWAGLPVPGLGPMTGLHWAAPLIDLAVALLLAAGASALLALFRRRAHVVVASQRLLHALMVAVAARVTPPAARRGWVRSPLDLFGTHILRRPPPLVAAS
jgi:hypothetical protein